MSEKKLPNWQANNFSDLRENFQKMAGKLWIGRSVKCVEIFRIFLTEFVRQ